MSFFNFFKPTKGFVENPLRKRPNVPCPCGSGLKAKKCHGRHYHMKKEAAKIVHDWLLAYDMEKSRGKSGSDSK